MQVNDAGYALIQQWEKLVLYAYDDANGHRINPGDSILGTLTIGYGHTGDDVYPGLNWTQQDADAAFYDDVDWTVDDITPGFLNTTLTDNQFSALVSLAYNIGGRAFLGCSALHLVNDNQLDKVPSHIRLWNRVRRNGRLVISKGLVRRRDAEVKLWNTPPVALQHLAKGLGWECQTLIKNID